MAHTGLLIAIILIGVSNIIATGMARHALRWTLRFCRSHLSRG